MIPNILEYVNAVFSGSPKPKLSREKTKIANHIVNVIQQAEDPMNSIEIEEDEQMNQSDDETIDTDWDPSADFCQNIPSPTDASEPNKVRFGAELVSVEVVEKAVELYGSIGIRTNIKRCNRGLKRPSLRTMQCRFPFLSNENHLKKLREFEIAGKIKSDASAAIRCVSLKLAEETKKAIQKGYVLHDDDLRSIAAEIMKKEDLKIDFKISHSWLNNFKRSNRISSRKITKFVAKSRFADKAVLEKNSEEFVEKVRSQIVNYGLHQVINCDQSGFQLELHTNRTLAETGSKKVEVVVQSVSATTHSYTIMPVFMANGKLSPILFVVLQEPKGKFPAKGHFQADNLVVEAHTTHIMTKSSMLRFFENVIFHPSMPKKLLMLVDSWSSWKDWESIRAIIPQGTELEMMLIPPGCTGMIQPCDVGLFGVYKQIVKRITRVAQRVAPNWVPHHRDNVLQMLSLVHWQLCSESMEDWLLHAWITGGYVDEDIDEYETGYEQMFPNNVATSDCCTPSCDSTSFIRCVYCEQYFCFSHFVLSYHRCC